MTIYFPYQSIVKRILALAAAGRREHIIRGGRGLGKTTILESLWRECQKPKAPISVFIEGRYVASAITKCKQAASGDVSYVFVDDIDHMLNNPAAVDAYDRFLTQRGDLLDPKRTAIIATSTITERELIQRAKTDESSNMITKSEITELNGWPADWETGLSKSVRVLLKDEAVVIHWARSIRDVTGGHPTLVGAALAELRDLLQLGSDATQGQHLLDRKVDEKTLGAFLRMRLASTGFVRIGRAFEQLSEDDRALLATAASDQSALTDLDPFRAARLLGSGLVYLDTADFRLHVVGGMIREQLARAQWTPRIELRHLPSSDAPNEAGFVRVMAGQRLVGTVNLSGASWKVLSIIFDGEGSVVSVEQLETLTGLKEAALNSALQRLRATLRSCGIERAIENVRNEGYRRADVPALRETVKSSMDPLTP